MTHRMLRWCSAAGASNSATQPIFRSPPRPVAAEALEQRRAIGAPGMPGRLPARLQHDDAAISLFETVGPFDARTDDDIDLVYRCYVASIPIEYAPDLVVLHYHGRKDPARGHKLFRTYMQQMGALYAKFALKDADLCRPLLWDLHNAAKEIVARKNLFLPEIGFSHKQRLYYNAVGAIKYWLRRPVSNST
jgi:hypothetical protein